MRATRTIERRPLLAAAFADWRTTQVDVRAIRFGPGQETGIHSHPCHVIGYIAEGAAILEIDGQPARRLETGPRSTSRPARGSCASTMRRRRSRSSSWRCTCCSATSR
jgi:hypothetical protein